MRHYPFSLTPLLRQHGRRFKYRERIVCVLWHGMLPLRKTYAHGIYYLSYNPLLAILPIYSLSERCGAL